MAAWAEPDHIEEIDTAVKRPVEPSTPSAPRKRTRHTSEESDHSSLEKRPRIAAKAKVPLRSKKDNDTAKYKKSAKSTSKAAPTDALPSSSQAVASEDWQQFMIDNLPQMLSFMQQLQEKTKDSTKESDPGSDASVKEVGEVEEIETVAPSLTSYRIPKLTKKPATTAPRGGDQSLSLNLDFPSVTPAQRQNRRDFDQFNEDNSDSDPDELQTPDVGRLEKRRMHLKTMRDVLPFLKHPTPANEPSTGSFSLLADRDKADKMPFLPQIFTQVEKVCEVFDKKPKNPFKSLPRYYPTTEAAETSLFQPRAVPRELVQMVHPDKVATGGVSGRAATLKNNTNHGAKEEAANRSFNQACGYIRLANNFELDAEVAHTLIRKVTKYTGRLGALELPPEADLILEEIAQKIQLLNATVFDISSTNADFLKSAIAQYQSALINKREAWISSAGVQPGAAKELRTMDFPKPAEAAGSASPQTMGLFGPIGSSVLGEYYTYQRESHLMGNRFFTPANNWYNRRNRQQRSDFQGYRGRGNRSFNDNYNSRGRGGRGGQGRGGRPSRRRGQGGQPFPANPKPKDNK
jgi:hypothetical protein